MQKFFICVFIMVAFVFSQSTPEKNTPGEDFNEYVLHALKSYPTNGTHQYYWPSSGGWAGNTKDLYYQGQLFSKGDSKGRCYCCGLTFEVFFDAYKKYCNDHGWQFDIKGFTATDLKKFRGLWFGADGNRKTLLNAVEKHNLGSAVSLEDARPGDFVQYWRHSGSGHSVIFIGWRRDSQNKITGLEYWSTQKSTGGIGYRTETVSSSSGIDPKQIYIARVGKKANGQNHKN